MADLNEESPNSRRNSSRWRAICAAAISLGCVFLFSFLVHRFPPWTNAQGCSASDVEQHCKRSTLEFNYTAGDSGGLCIWLQCDPETANTTLHAKCCYYSNPGLLIDRRDVCSFNQKAETCKVDSAQVWMENRTCHFRIEKPTSSDAGRYDLYIGRESSQLQYSEVITPDYLECEVIIKPSCEDRWMLAVDLFVGISASAIFFALLCYLLYLRKISGQDRAEIGQSNELVSINIDDNHTL